MNQWVRKHTNSVKWNLNFRNSTLPNVQLYGSNGNYTFFLLVDLPTSCMMSFDWRNEPNKFTKVWYVLEKNTFQKTDSEVAYTLSCWGQTPYQLSRVVKFPRIYFWEKYAYFPRKFFRYLRLKCEQNSLNNFRTNILNFPSKFVFHRGKYSNVWKITRAFPSPQQHSRTNQISG